MKGIIEQTWDDLSLLQRKESQEAIRELIALLDKGQVRVAEQADGKWQVNEWVKKGVILYFRIQPMEVQKSGIFEFYDKIDLKHGFDDLQVRVVPQATARYGSYLAPNVVMMPSYVNIGAYVDSGTMIDTWATVGSCAQIGKDVHLSGGVGIGGVLEPVQAAPVIIEEHCFIGSRAIIVEGVHVKKNAVLGANVVITQTTHIIDVTQSQPVTLKGIVPENAVVIPGSYTKTFAAGNYQVPCALIIGKRKTTTDLKTSLNEALRDFNVAI